MSARACLAAVPLSSQFRAAFARRLSCSTRADFPVPTPLRQQSANAAVSLEENFYSKFLKSFEKIRIKQCFWQFDEQFIFGDQKVRFPHSTSKINSSIGSKSNFVYNSKLFPDFSDFVTKKSVSYLMTY